MYDVSLMTGYTCNICHYRFGICLYFRIDKYRKPLVFYHFSMFMFIFSTDIDNEEETIFFHKNLCTQLFEAIFKSTKGCFQTTKTMFESWDSHAVWTWFNLLKNPQDGTYIVYMTWNDNAKLPRNKHFVLIFVDINIITFPAEWRQKEWKTKWSQRMCTVLWKRFYHDFSGVFDGIFHGIIWIARITIKHVCFSA